MRKSKKEDRKSLKVAIEKVQNKMAKNRRAERFNGQFVR